MNLTTQHMLLGNADDRDGMLVLDGDALVAVLCRLSAHHGDQVGHCFIECSFGVGPFARDSYATLEDACIWISKSIAARESEKVHSPSRKPKGAA